MIFAVRLRPYNKKAGNKMKSYLSGHSRTKYTVGTGGQPSPIRVVTDRKELMELREWSQFEIIPFESREELDKFITRETLQAVRKGKPVVKPVVLKGPVEPGTEDDVDDDLDEMFDMPQSADDEDEVELDDLLTDAPVVTPEDPDGDVVYSSSKRTAKKNTGRKPGKKTATKKKTTKKKRS